MAHQKNSLLPSSTLWTITIMGILLFSIPIFVHAGYTDYPKTHKALERLLETASKLGDALVIAAILIISIDEESRLKLIEAVVRAASPKLIGRHLPEAVQNSVLRYFKIEFFRPELRITYDLEPVAGWETNQPAYLKITMRIKGTLRNCGANAESFTYFGSVDPPVVPLAPKPRITVAKLEAEDGRILFELDIDNQDSTADIVSIQRPITLSPKTTYTTTFESITYKPMTYFLPLYIGTTTVQANLSIRYPKELLDVRLQVSTLTDLDPVPEITNFGSDWDLKEPILPGNCILTTWLPKVPRSNSDEIVLPEVLRAVTASDLGS